MKKLLVTLMITLALITILFSGCGSNSNTTKEKVYGKGEEAFIVDSSGKQLYSFKVNSVKTANDFEYKDDFSNAKQIIEVRYTYKNIAKDGPLYIHGSDFVIADSTGAVGQSSDMYPGQQPQEIATGMNCTVQAYYGLSNESKIAKIAITSKQYPNNGTIIFEVPIE